MYDFIHSVGSLSRKTRRKRLARFEPLYLKPASYELKPKAGAAR